MIKKSLYLAAGALLAFSIATPSLAGERTGNGGSTPIGTYAVLAAICAFSGLEDYDGGPVVPGDTQTPHGEGDNVFPAGVAAICQFLNPGKNPKEPPPPPE